MARPTPTGCPSVSPCNTARCVNRAPWKERGLRVPRNGVGERVPPISDPRWEAWSALLHQFLAEPRDWGAIEIWRTSVQLGGEHIRHMLAWLETVGFARSFYRDDVLFWIAEGILRKSAVRLAAAPEVGDIENLGS